MFKLHKYLERIAILFALLSIANSAYTQNQNVADSLILLLDNPIKQDSSTFKLLNEIAANHTYPDETIRYSNLLIKAAQSAKNDYWLHKGYLELGSAYRLKGDLDKALDAFIKCSESAIKAQYAPGIGTAYSSIADIYSISGNGTNALSYYNKAIEVLSDLDESIAYASVLLNTGDEYLKYDDYDQALKYFEKSGDIFLRLDYEIGTAYNLGNIGMVYAKLGNGELAEKNINDAVDILEKYEDFAPICEYYMYMSDIYVEKGDQKTAFDYAIRSLDLANKKSLKNEMSAANLKLSELYEQSGEPIEALKYFKAYISNRDSVNNIETVQRLADLRTDYEVSQKQVEVDLLHEQKRNQRIIFMSVVIALCLIGLWSLEIYRRYKLSRRTNKIIELEKNRSESLLLNILPYETAKELKLNGKVKARKYDSVSVMFTDFKGFTSLAEGMKPEDLVESVDYYFSKFDGIIEKYGLEKIKTIGDSYMCAGGLPDHDPGHTIKMIKAAFEIIKFVEEVRSDAQNTKAKFDIRIGIHVGPVVAGVVGTKKFAYDIWGDTVNVASRLETNSELSRINVSQNVVDLISSNYHCEHRGNLQVKNRGKMKMYFVNDVRNN